MIGGPDGLTERFGGCQALPRGVSDPVDERPADRSPTSSLRPTERDVQEQPGQDLAPSGKLVSTS